MRVSFGKENRTCANASAPIVVSTELANGAAHKFSVRARRIDAMGHEATSDFAYSITSSAVARSKGEIVPLFSFNVPRDGWWVSDVWGALDGRIPPGLRVVPTSHSLD